MQWSLVRIWIRWFLTRRIRSRYFSGRNRILPQTTNIRTSIYSLKVFREYLNDLFFMLLSYYGYFHKPTSGEGRIQFFLGGGPGSGEKISDQYHWKKGFKIDPEYKNDTWWQDRPRPRKAPPPRQMEFSTLLKMYIRRRCPWALNPTW